MISLSAQSTFYSELPKKAVVAGFFPCSGFMAKFGNLKKHYASNSVQLCRNMSLCTMSARKLIG